MFRDQTLDQRKLEENPEAKQLLRNQLPKLEELRNLTDSDQEPSHSEKSENSKSQLNSSLESFHSKDSLEKLQTTSRLT